MTPGYFPITVWDKQLLLNLISWWASSGLLQLQSIIWAQGGYQTTPCSHLTYLQDVNDQNRSWQPLTVSLKDGQPFILCSEGYSFCCCSI